MKNILVGVLMIVATLVNLFFCFWVGDIVIEIGGWFVFPSLVTLFVWFFGLALCFGLMAEKMSEIANDK